METRRTVSGHYLASFAFTLIIFIGFSLARLIFWQWFDNAKDPVPRGVLAEAFWIGAKFDLRLALILTLPMLVLGGHQKIGLRAWPRLWSGTIVVLFVASALFYMFDFGYYAYLSSRLDSSALRFMNNPLISLGMLWESYPVVFLGLGLTLITAAVTWSVYRLVCYLGDHYYPVQHRFKAWAVVTVLVIFGLYGKVSWYPLRWSDAFFSPYSFASSLASNPVLYFVATFKNRELVFDKEMTSYFFERNMKGFLGADSNQPVDFVRKVKPPEATPLKNVVIVVLESFAMNKTSMGGNPLDATPHFQELSRQGLLFNRCYTPHMGTARGIWATVTGIPDVEFQRTSSRNPMIVNQHSIINAFEDYQKYYFLGGSVSWANIRGFLSTNIEDLTIYEEGSYQSPKIDVWGISDLDLFKEAHAVFKQTNKPFFSIIQTSGNHRPYTIPEDRDGFEVKVIDDAEAQRYGFVSSEEYNAFRLLDFSVKRFMEIAAEEAYFEDTLFIFFGDHGLAGYAGDHAPKAVNQLEINRFHVPLLFYGKNLVPIETRDTVASQVDVLPTTASLLKVPYTNTTLGRDLLDPRFDETRFAFTIQRDKREIGLLDGDYYMLMNLDGSHKTLHDLRADEPRVDVSAENPERMQKLSDYCLGIFETANYMRYHNPKQVHRD